HPSPGATADVEAWERLWARSGLVLHAEGQVLTSSLSAPCDLPAELVPCWQTEPDGPCQALPGLRQPAVGQVSGAPWGAGGTGGTWVTLTEHPSCQQGPQEFGGLRLHPNLCVQVWSGRQVRLTQCLRDSEYCQAGGQGKPGDQAGGCPSLASPRCRPHQPPVTSPGALPGRADDLLLLQHGGNASLCALERGTCTPLASFTSTVRGRDPHVPVMVVPVAQPGYPLPLLQGAGRPGLLERELRRDVVAGHCRQIRHPENGTGVTLWACPLHKYLRARWVLAWMGVLLGAACLLLLLLLKKEDVKG
ncbi:I17RC protein, partial [Stercorarius parasiticus]|nr:I17RC protein [Stercorarius parasiticus]